MNFSQSVYSFFYSQMYIIPAGIVVSYIIQAILKKRRKTQGKEPVSPKSINAQVARLTNLCLQGYVSEDRKKVEEIVQSIRTALLMHDAAKGAVSAEHTLFMLRDALLKIDGKALSITNEEQALAEKIIQQHVALCNANGFKTR